MNLRQAVAFAVLMGADPRDRDPRYIREKVATAKALAVPEQMLDMHYLAIFERYRDHWKLDWDAERDLSEPISKVLERSR